MSNIINSYRYASTEIDGIISYWPLSANSNDSVGSNNGTDTSISYVAGGIIGDQADFSASTSANISIADSPTLSFPLQPFSISFWFEWDSITTSMFFSKRDLTIASIIEYDFYYQAGFTYFRVFSGGTNANFMRVQTGFLGTAVTGQLYNFIITYDGGTTNTGLNVYQNGSINTSPPPIHSTTGTFVSMTDTATPLMLGKIQIATTFSLNGKMSEAYLFDKELTPSEALFVYNEGVAGRTLI